MPLSRSRTLFTLSLIFIHINDLDAIEAIYGVIRYEFLHDSNLLFSLTLLCFVAAHCNC